MKKDKCLSREEMRGEKDLPFVMSCVVGELCYWGFD